MTTLGKIPEKDRSILRTLAEEVAAIAALPVQRETAELWRRLNRREPVRPLVWINEIPWHEMDVDGELTLQSSHKFARGVENNLRLTLYQWKHLRGDMVVTPVYYSPLVIRDTGFGIREDVKIIRSDEKSGVVSREFHQQIREEKDLEKIKTPVLTHDTEASERNYQAVVGLIGDLLPVKKCGIVHSWFAPWDELIRWWDVQEALMDMILRPELVHQAMDRLVNAYLVRLDQWEALNVLSIQEGNYRVGSGGYAYTDKLPQSDFNPARVRTMDQWGCATAQIFSEVSPEMHEAFALQYERRWLKRFGMNYYGCCEPLHNKLDILGSVPNLRKISMSPWANVEKMVEQAAPRYVLSHKPNPAVLATDAWNPQLARQNLKAVLDQTCGCAIEVILKDISTARYQPRRLWEWEKMAMATVAEYT